MLLVEIKSMPFF